MELLLDFLPFLAIIQEIISATIVALNPLLSSPLGLLSTRARTTLALFWLLVFHNLDHLDAPPRRAPLDLCYNALFLFFIFESFASFSSSTCLGPVSTPVDLQMLGHGNGDLQIALHMGAHMFLQVWLRSKKEGMECLLISHPRKGDIVIPRTF